MSKDPAFLFYPADFMIGTALMTFEQKGKYISLLCYQHQLGHLSKEDMLAVCGDDKKIFSKFVQDENSLYYNERLENEKFNRKKWTKSRQNNLKSSTHMDAHMEDVNESNTTIQPKTTEFKYLGNVSFVACFNDYLEMRKKIRKPATERAEQLALKSLHEHPLETAIKMLNQSVMNSWQGIFPLKDIGGVMKKSILSPPSVKYEEFKPSEKPDPNQQEEVYKLMQQTLKEMKVVK